MRSFSKSGLNAHTGRILGIARRQNFAPAKRPATQEGSKTEGQEDRTQAAWLSSATDTDTYVILKYLSRTHIFEIVFSGFVSFSLLSF